MPVNFCKVQLDNNDICGWQKAQYFVSSERFHLYTSKHLNMELVCPLEPDTW